VVRCFVQRSARQRPGASPGQMPRSWPRRCHGHGTPTDERAAEGAHPPCEVAGRAGDQRQRAGPRRPGGPARSATFPSCARCARRGRMVRGMEAPRLGRRELRWLRATRARHGCAPRPRGRSTAAHECSSAGGELCDFDATRDTTHKYPQAYPERSCDDQRKVIAAEIIGFAGCFESRRPDSNRGPLSLRVTPGDGRGRATIAANGKALDWRSLRGLGWPSKCGPSAAHTPGCADASTPREQLVRRRRRRRCVVQRGRDELDPSARPLASGSEQRGRPFGAPSSVNSSGGSCGTLVDHAGSKM
jgi:hypothetical protein